MTKTATAIITLTLMTCVFGGALIYLLFLTPPNDACWRRTPTGPPKYVIGNETWDIFTTTIILDQEATVTVNFSSHVSSGGGGTHCNLSLRWDGISYWNYMAVSSATRSNFSQFTFSAGTYTLTLSLEEDLDSSLENTFLEVCVTYS